MSTMLTLLDRADSWPGAAELRSRTYELLRPAEFIVDVGCGAGRAVAELGPGAVGIDVSEEMIQVARIRWPESDFRVGSATALPFGDGAVGGYRADKVLHAVPDPAAVLVEARRVLAPGGRIVLVGQDWDTIVIDSDDPALTRRLVQARADKIASPRAARRYRNLLLECGFRDVVLEVHTAVFTDAAMLPMLAGMAGAETGWLAEQTRRAESGRMFVALPMFLAAATRVPG
ncbi:MAG: methyltransferase domain-containing protein [Kibdelosporangium sp.]